MIVYTRLINQDETNGGGRGRLREMRPRLGSDAHVGGGDAGLDVVGRLLLARVLGGVLHL